MQFRKSLRVAIPPIITSVFIVTILMTPFAYAAPGDETTYYLLTDHLGSVDVVLNENGEVVERRDYLPYGQERSARAEPNSPTTDHKFTGKVLDPETDLYYYGARYYDPLTSTFLALDPWSGELSNPQSLNKYSYVLNNPLKFIDPTGMYNMKSGEVEKGDTLGSITGELNGHFGTRLTYQDLASINSISDPNRIEIGQIVKMGTVNSDGSTWQRAYDADEVTIGYWNGLNQSQQKITHYGRNLFQEGELPLTEEYAIASGNFNFIGEAVAHNIGIGVMGNKDYRGSAISAGQQAIYGPNGMLVTSEENKGTFDFGQPGSKAHKIMDVEPWKNWGNSPQDRTTIYQREAAVRHLMNISDWADYYHIQY